MSDAGAKRKAEDCRAAEPRKQDALPGGGKPPKSPKTLAGSPSSSAARGDVSQVPTVKKELSPASMAASAAAAAKAAADAAADTSAEQESEWRTEGSAFVGRGILRTVQDDDGQPGEGWGKIKGWLSSDESDFVNERGEPAALWHVVFDDQSLGEEDLEEHEVKAAVIAWELAMREATRGGKKRPKVAGNGKGKRGGAKAPEGDGTSFTKDFRVYFVEDADGNKGLPQLAKDLQVDPADVIRLNSERYKGLKNSSSCRLKPHTVLILPPMGAAGPLSNAEAALQMPAATEQPNTTSAEPAAVASAEAPAGLPAPSVPPAPEAAKTAPPKPALDPKSALLLLQKERNGMPASDAASAASAASTIVEEPKRRSEGGRGDSSNYLMAMRPNLSFPPFPGVTEAMGAISREYVMNFYCPFEKKQGITYAAPGFEAVAPVTAEVENQWAECDECQKWRRLPPTFIVADGAPFKCSDADR